jgi:Flp pilus assembly protein TadG
MRPGCQRAARTSKTSSPDGCQSPTLWRDERGVTSVVFGILFAVLLLATAIAIDYTRATHESMRQQHAIDAAALAASHRLGLPDQDETGPAVAEAFFRENMGEGSTAQIEVELDAAAGTVRAWSQNDLAMTLMRANVKEEHRRESLNIGARTTVVKGSGTLEVAMALDNSGSMAGSPINALKDAARDLVNIVFAGAEGTDDVRVGIVPFAASVNVGSSMRSQGWIYQDRESDLPFPLFTGNASRFDILSQMNQNWRGCVEARPAPFDTLDTPPDPGNINTMFVPMFAPDEPNDENATNAGYSASGGDASGYPNNYLTDFGGTCPPPAQQCVAWRTVGGVRSCRTWAPVPIGVVDAQRRACKYQGASPSTFQGSASGPHAACTTPPILDLTEIKRDVEDAIDALVANGNTNISEGTMWAWRLLSPGAPFTRARAYNAPDNRKFLIVMTDGDNFLGAKSQHNRSVYGAYGYGSQNRLGTTYTQNGYMNALNAKTLAACTNAKAQGITVYTVAFGDEISSTGLTLLRNCATNPDRAYIAADEAALIQAFQTIGREIAKLRVSS